MKYIDTSVIVAALDHLNHRWERAHRLLERGEDKIVSELVLAEFSSVLSRRRKLLENIEHATGLRQGLGIIVLVTYILKKYNIKYVSADDSLLLPPIGRIYSVIAEAIRLSSKISLKTLDLLHLAYISILKKKGYPLRELVTLDEDFIEKKDEIKQVLDIDVTTI